MAVPHARPGEVIELASPRDGSSTTLTRTLFKTDALEVIRMVIPAGKEIATHQAPGELTVQCLEGRVAFTSLGATVELGAGQLVYLPPREPHSVRGAENSVLLLTLLLPARSEGKT